MDAEEAQRELARLAETLARANSAYHAQDAPEITDAEYDALKRRNAAIEARFPQLKRERQPERAGGCRPVRGLWQDHTQHPDAVALKRIRR